MAGLVGVFGQTAYCAAKHAVNGFSEALRLELEPLGITVQVVCPGEFDSPMWNDSTPTERRKTVHWWALSP
jgi:3-dehydrosphinganine reductase